ncbi:alpha/beta hydrolase family protein [Nocardiopsis metallicus]|uniref:Pimeloyl-ACP methyl ester carboxylesterase n=1 Tax=Nocardiopsis metallicus TaxID=179819 RepID=A0A840WUE2_9ACTN|nr:prolyl oligopeptidase family serine peptidase [Nocardiopsis metallicus]MBB5493768.1 pimeloyl-ACP methyl ester carboxylesterase [Nocardiopsis metallicus]
MVVDAPSLSAPLTGTAAGVPFLALPPAAATDVPAPLVVGLHAFEPPRSESALAGAVPMASLPAWRVYLGLPLFGHRLPEGGVAEINQRGERDYLVELFGPVVEEAAAELRRVVDELRSTFPVADVPVGLVGVGAGASAVLLALAEKRLPLGAAAVINPIVDPSLLMAARERRTGTPYRWGPQAQQTRSWLDFSARAAEISGTGTPMLVVNGGRDEVAPPEHGRAFHDVLTRQSAEQGLQRDVRHALRHIVVPDLAHAIGPEPGLEPGPLTPAGVLTDRALTEWFHLHLTTSTQVQAPADS